MITILITTKDKNEARTIAKGLLEERLVACANIIDGVESHFWWEGKIDLAQEALIILKTERKMFKKVEAKVKSLHSYKNPEIVGVSIVEGSSSYLQWIKDSIK